MTKIILIMETRISNHKPTNIRNIEIEGYSFQYKEFKKIDPTKTVVYPKLNNRGYVFKLSQINNEDTIAFIADITFINPLRMYTLEISLEKINGELKRQNELFLKQYYKTGSWVTNDLNPKEGLEEIIYDLIVQYEREKKLNTLLDE